MYVCRDHEYDANQKQLKRDRERKCVQIQLISNLDKIYDVSLYYKEKQKGTTV